MPAPPSFNVGFWLGDVSPQHGGIAPYALRILSALLADARAAWRFTILCDAASAPYVEHLVARAAGTTAVRIIPAAVSGAAEQIVAPTHGELGLFDKLKARLSVARRTRAPSPPHAPSPPAHHIEMWLRSLGVDLLHFPTQTILHPDLQRTYALALSDVRDLPCIALPVPHVITMHDVQELHFPEYFTPAQRATRAVHYWKSIEQAIGVIVSFAHVKADLIRYFGVPEDKVHVCPIPFGSIKLAEPIEPDARAYVEKYAAWTPFLIYPAHTWRHKNHHRLLEALRRMHSEHNTDLRLICTGGIDHHHHAQVVAEVARLGLIDSVLFTGVVPESELTWLYRHTALVTIPTEYEAGSFPLFEAISIGAPVICSDVTSLPETIGDRRFVFGARDVEALTALIRRMISDDDFRRDNLANNRLQAARLLRVDAASPIYETYARALGLSESADAGTTPDVV